jgi:hypothetical protein
LWADAFLLQIEEREAQRERVIHRDPVVHEQKPATHDAAGIGEHVGEAHLLAVREHRGRGSTSR